MSGTRMVGVGVLILGIILLVLGMVNADSVGEQFTKTFTGEFTDGTTLMLLFGIIGSVLGGAMTLFGSKGETA